MHNRQTFSLVDQDMADLKLKQLFDTFFYKNLLKILRRSSYSFTQHLCIITQLESAYLGHLFDLMVSFKVE